VLYLPPASSRDSSSFPCGDARDFAHGDKNLWRRWLGTREGRETGMIGGDADILGTVRSRFLPDLLF
jgi:hypothetical protein